jgi:predicted dithiol-disulfide oxidoreductase (DUF899 family)
MGAAMLNKPEGKELIEGHEVVSEGAWLDARRELLEKEKEMAHKLEELNRERRTLPWTRTDKEYVFDGPNGRETLAELFGNNNQLIVYHFMFGPGWDEGCVGCSFVSDHFDCANLHLKHRDISLVAVSRAPWKEFEAFKKRMGWQFKWVSSSGSDFNYDYQVSHKREDIDRGDVFYNYKNQKLTDEEQPGLSVFYKNADGEIFHTYSTYERGLDILLGTHHLMDMTPRGRRDHEGFWWRHHDRYDDESNP